MKAGDMRSLLLLLLPFASVSQYATQDYHQMTIHESDNTDAYLKSEIVVRPGVDAKPKCTGDQILTFSQLPGVAHYGDQDAVEYNVDGPADSPYSTDVKCVNVFKKNYWICDCFRPVYELSAPQSVDELQGVTVRAVYNDANNFIANVIRRLDCILETDFFLPFVGSSGLPSHPGVPTTIRYTPTNYTVAEMFEYACNAYNDGTLRDSRRCPPWHGYPTTLVFGARKSDGQATKACPKGSVAKQVLRRKCFNKQISYPEGWEGLQTSPNTFSTEMPIRDVNMPQWGPEDEVWEVTYEDDGEEGATGYIDSAAVFPAWNIASYDKVLPEKRGRCDQDTSFQVACIIGGSVSGVLVVILALLYYKICDPAPKIHDKELEVGDDVWVKGATVPISVEQGRIQASRKLHATVTAISMNRRQITVRYDGGGTGVVDASQVEVDLTRRPHARGERGEADELDVLYHYDDSICKCCPRGCTVGTVTIAMMCFAVALGAAFNIAFWEFTPNQRADWGKGLKWIGVMWLNMLQLVAVPILCLIMIVTPSRVANMGGKATRAILLFIFSSAFAAFEAVIIVNLLRPGENVQYLPNPNNLDADLPAAKRAYYAGVADLGPDNVSEIDALLGIGYAAFPKSIISAMANGNILGCLLFFVMFGWILKQHKYNVMSEWRVTVLYFCKGCLKVLMVMVNWLISFAPWAMFSLVLGSIAGINDFSHAFTFMGIYLVVVTGANIIHQIAFHFLVLFGFAHTNPFKYYFRVSNAVFKGFATGSSAAAMPITLKSVKGPGEVRKEVAEFLIPLGAAINKDGTALTLPIAVVFVAQAYGMTVPWLTQILVATMSVAVSIAAAPVPYASVMYLAMLMRVCGETMLEPGVITHAIALLLVFEWYTDRLATATNVWSDCVITKIIDTWERRKKQGVKIAAEPELADA